MEEKQTSFPELLEALRVARRISKTALAKLTGLTPGYISHLTRGERIAPSEDAVSALADALKLDTETRAQLFYSAGYPFHSPSVASTFPPQLATENGKMLPIHKENWGEAPNAEVFYGREKTLTKLTGWLVEDHCQMVAVLGMGGIGKTLLTVKLAEQVKDAFDVVFWRSLQNAPPLENILEEYIQFLLSPEQIDLPKSQSDLISLVIKCMQEQRCLIILDNFESILLEGHEVGLYREGYNDYGTLLQRLAGSRHQSCLVLTSRERPKEISRLEGKTLPVRSIELPGVGLLEGRELLKEKDLLGSDENWAKLIGLYSGNPLALKLVSEYIREVFAGSVVSFLEREETVFGDIYDLLDQQFHRLSALEQEIMYWLAIAREAISLEHLQEDLAHAVEEGELLVALGSLRRRSMIETKSIARFTLQPVIMEYVTNEYVRQVVKEIETGEFRLLASHALIKALAKNYVRDRQTRLILKPIADTLLSIYGKATTEEKLKNLLSVLRSRQHQVPDYTAGNIINLMIQLNIDLQGFDFSHLVVQQAYLQNVALPGVNFADANITKSLFTEAFGNILSIALSSNGKLLAAGTASGEVRVWQLSSNIPVQILQGHRDWVWSVAFSPDGTLLASGSEDQTVRIWQVSTGRAIRVLQGHRDWIYSVAFSPDGTLLASGGDDQTVHIWQVNTGQTVRVLQGHTNRIRSVAFSPDGTLLASGGDDQTVHIWQVNTGQIVRVLQGHTNWAYSIAFSPDGTLLASGSEDQAIHIWQVNTGQTVRVLQGHTNRIRSVAFSPDGTLLASGSDDQTVHIWQVNTGQTVRVLQGHTSRIYSVAFSSDGELVTSGSEDQTARIWEVSTGQCLDILQGHINRIWSVAFSPNGELLASGSDDQTVRIWDINAGKVLRALRGHINRIWSVAFSPNGELLASGSDDQTVRIWQVSTGQCLHILQGHAKWIRSIAFSPNGELLVSGSEDQTVRIWQVSTGQCLHILQGHADWIRSVAFSPNGEVLASGSDDQTIRIWQVGTGQCLHILQGHTNRIYSVAFSPNGELLASGSEDQTVHLWQISTNQNLYILHGHHNRVNSIAFSPDGNLLVSGGDDQTVRLWNVETGEIITILQGHTDRVWSVAFSCDNETLASGSNDGTIRLWQKASKTATKILRSERPYEHMDITGVTGLTAAQKAALKALGAIENKQ